MSVYHITRNDNIEKCIDYSNCAINGRLHFDNLSKALQILDSTIDISMLNPSTIKVNRYEGEINYNSGFTVHYEGERLFREMELIRILGEGRKVKAFKVHEEESNIQIQELLDNAILKIYSFHTHRKITLFAPHPERIISLYASIGEFPPEWLIKKSENNVRKGYNNICL